MIIDQTHPDGPWIEVSRPNGDRLYGVTRVDLTEGKVYYLGGGWGAREEKVYEGPFLLWDTRRNAYWRPDAPEPDVQAIQEIGLEESDTGEQSVVSVVWGTDSQYLYRLGPDAPTTSHQITWTREMVNDFNGTWINAAQDAWLGYSEQSRHVPENLDPSYAIEIPATEETFTGRVDWGARYGGAVQVIIPGVE